MPDNSSNRLLRWGWWLLVVGFFTTWLFGIGLLFILAAFTCAFAGLFRQRVGESVALLAASLVAGFIGAHLAAIAGIYAFNHIREGERPEVTISNSPRHR